MKSYLRSLAEELVRIIDDSPERLTKRELFSDLLLCFVCLGALSLGAYFVIFGLLSL
jgi:hypothetical protein